MVPPDAGRRRPQQARARRTVRRILDAAYEILATDGAEAFNTNRIAEEAGIGVGTLYGYFPDKHAVAVALADEIAAVETEAVLAELERVGSQPLAATIPPLVAKILEVYGQHAAVTTALQALAAADRGRLGQRPGEQAVQSAVAERFRQAQAAKEIAVEDPDLAAELLFTVVEAAAHRYTRPGGTTVPRTRLVEELSRLVMGYLEGAGLKASRKA